MSEQSKCPFTGAGTPPKFPTGRGTSNKDWWPKLGEYNWLGPVLFVGMIVWLYKAVSKNK